MLVRVRLPPFGNTIFEATIPLPVTFIMSQFGGLTFIYRCDITILPVHFDNPIEYKGAYF